VFSVNSEFFLQNKAIFGFQEDRNIRQKQFYLLLYKTDSFQLKKMLLATFSFISAL